jgi:hypothetical protein
MLRTGRPQIRKSFNVSNVFGRVGAQGLTQTLTEMSARSFLGVKCGHLCRQFSRKCGMFNVSHTRRITVIDLVFYQTLNYLDYE